jgi:hypothetical protein
MAKLDADAVNVKTAGKIFIELGTNDALSSSGPTNADLTPHIQAMMQKIKSLNPTVQVYWMNLHSSKHDLTAANNTLTANAGAQGYQVVDWHKEVTANAAKYNFDSTIGVHLDNNGYASLSDFVVKSIAGPSTNTPTVSVGGCNCSVSTATTLAGNDNIEKIWNFFIGKGFTPVQTAGAMGNIQRESAGSWNPRIVEYGWGFPKEMDTIPPKKGPQGQPGYGIIQWTSGGRKDGLQKFADSHGGKVNELSTQLDYMWFELEGPYKAKALDPIRQSNDLATVVRIWQDKYEVGKHFEPRMKYAQAIYAKYGSGGGAATPTPTTGTTPIVSTSTGSCADVTTAGQNTKFLEGFAVYSQYDPAWKDKPYSSSTIGQSGCGPSAMAMIITALTGTKVTPVETSNYAASQGLYVPGQGSKWTIAPVLAKQWGLKAQPIGADVAKITATLQAGGLVIAGGSGALPFTSGGHFIVIRGVTASGKFKVGDSGHKDTSDKEWDANQLVGIISGSNHAGTVYAITK